MNADPPPPRGDNRGHREWSMRTPRYTPPTKGPLRLVLSRALDRVGIYRERLSCGHEWARPWTSGSSARARRRRCEACAADAAAAR